MKRLALLIVLCLLASVVLAHGGGLDGNGCHRNKKEGNYHCHKGPEAGKTFASKEAYEKSKGKKK